MPLLIIVREWAKSLNKNLIIFSESLRLQWSQLIISLFIGLVGALLFAYLTLPLPWLIGPAFATTITAMSGVKIWMPNELRIPMFFLIGASFGLNLSPNIGEQVWLWIPSIVSVAVYVAAAVWMASAYLHYFARFDPVTAYFSATPGGLITMLALGESYGGDVRTMALVQAVRLIATILIIPLAFRLWGGYIPPDALWPQTLEASTSIKDLAILGVICVASYFIARKLRIPAPHLLGPMIAIGAFKLLGAFDTSIPHPLLSIAFLFIGTSIGASFNGVKVKEVTRTLLHGLAVGTIMIVLAVVFALGTYSFNGGTINALILAFAPGGFAEMALVASGLGIDVVFVIAHQLARYLMVLGLAPIAIRLIRRKSQN
jgi:membrane AbrB-like protein